MSDQTDRFQAQPVTLRLRHSHAAGLRWGAGNPVKVLALHGWLDNAAAFAQLGPRLAAQGAEVLALDLPGHGLSDHKPAGEIYHMLDNLLWIDQVLDVLAEDYPILMGHSLGGVLSLLYASAASERLRHLVILDALGPFTSKDADMSAVLTKGLHKARQQSAPKRLYASLDEAAEDRTKGFGGLSRESALHLVARNMEPHEGGWRWRSDARLRWPSLSRMNEAQVEACLRAVNIPSLLVFGDQGFFPDEASRAGRMVHLSQATQATVPGPHHLHMDGDLPALTQVITHYLKNEGYPCC